MQAPDLNARLANVDDYSTFLKAWLKHDEAMRAELGLGRAEESDGETLFQMLLRGEEDESLATIPDNESIARFETLEGELSTVRGELEHSAQAAQANLVRAETAEGEVTRLEATVTERETTIEQLRATPLQRKPPVQYPAALERGFSANALLDGGDPATDVRALLTAQRDAVREAAQKETDALLRAPLVARWMSLDDQLKSL